VAAVGEGGVSNHTGPVSPSPRGARFSPPAFRPSRPDVAGLGRVLLAEEAREALGADAPLAGRTRTQRWGSTGRIGGTVHA